GQVDEALSEFALAAEAGSGDVSRAMAAMIVPGSPNATNASVLHVRQDWARRVFSPRGAGSEPAGPGPEGTAKRSAGCQPAPQKQGAGQTTQNDGLPHGQNRRGLGRNQSSVVEGSKLRIGYLSSFFQRRNWMKPVWGAINHHDRESFEI